MRMLLLIFLVIVAVNCNPFRDRWELRDDFGGEWGVDDGPSRRRARPPPFYHPEFFDGDDDSGSDERQPNFGMQDYFQQLFKKYFEDLANATKTLNGLPPNYHNETSKTKVVDGLKVTVNETIDKETDENNDTFIIASKVVDVQPQNATDDSSVSPPPVAATPAPEPKESTPKAEESSTKPSESSTKPSESSTKPSESSTKPSESSTKPAESSTKPSESSTKAAESSTASEDSSAPTSPASVVTNDVSLNELSSPA